MAKTKTPTCSLTLPLKIEKWQADKLDKRFEVARKLYNTFIGFELKKLKRLEQTPEYRDILNQIKIESEAKKEDKKIVNELYKKRNTFLKEAGFTEFSFTNDMTGIYKYYNASLGAITSQSIANDAWRAFDTLLFRKGRRVSFKRFGEVNSVSGKSTNKEIMLKTSKQCIEWKGLILPYKIERDNLYEERMLSHNVKFVRILRRWGNTKYNYYAQIVLEGFPEIKTNQKTGEIKYPIGEGRVGLDIGTQTLAYVSDNKVGLVLLADRVVSIEKEKRILQRKLDRSRRATNPGNYNENGTVKRGIKLTRNKSKRYHLIQAKLKMFQRKQADIRKIQHNILANELLPLGDQFYVETMNFSGLSRRAKKTEVSEKTGKIKSKSRFGKSIANRAPAMLIQIIDSKLKNRGRKGIVDIRTAKAKASQFSHISGEYTKKSLGCRWNTLENGDRIQRDLYSAFLIQNTDNTLAAFDQELINLKYPNFKVMHDECMENIKESEQKLPSSIGA